MSEERPEEHVEERDEPIEAEDLLPRAFALLVRGGAQATALFAVLTGVTGAVTFGVANWILAGPRGAEWGPLFAGIALVTAGLVVVPMVVLAGPLGALVEAVDGRPSLRATLGRVVGSFGLALLGAVLLEGFFLGPIDIVGAWILTEALSSRRSPGEQLVWVLVGLVPVAVASAIHGYLLVSNAAEALGRTTSRPFGSAREVVTTFAIGALPFGAGTVMVGAAMLRRNGFSVVPEWAPGQVVVLGGAGILVAAHIVSCALAVALASRGAGGRERGARRGRESRRG